MILEARSSFLRELRVAQTLILLRVLKNTENLCATQIWQNSTRLV